MKQENVKETNKIEEEDKKQDVAGLASSSRPTGEDQLAQNFRENSGNNPKDIELTKDGSADYR